MAANLTISQPSNGDFLGRTNSISFNATNAVSKLTLTCVATSSDDPNVKVTVSKDFTPNANMQASGTINLNFTESQLSGPYILSFTVNSADSYNSIPDVSVTVDVINPKILNFNPIQDTFVQGQVKFTADLDELNIKEWRLTVNGSDIPNNTGDTSTVSVDWDTDQITKDGNQTLNFTVTDKAGNTASKSIPVTLDRLKPTSSVLSPVSNQSYPAGARLPVVVNVQDQFNNSLDQRTIDVTITDTQGNFIDRVAFMDATAQGTGILWTGRIRDTSNYPSTFVIKVAARDKAGNIGLDQTVTIVQTRSVAGFSYLADPKDPNSSQSVRDSAHLAFTRGLLSGRNSGLSSRSPRDIFGRGYKGN